MCSDLVTASQICALFSATGILFMSFVGILLMKQPFFILGIDDVEAAKKSAFGAAGMFFCTFFLSVVYLLTDGREENSHLVESTPQIMGRRGQQSYRFGEYSNVAFSDEAGDNNSSNELHYA